MPVRGIRVGAQHDLLDQTAQDLHRLGAAFRIVQRSRQIRNLRRVNIRQPRVQDHRAPRGQGGQFCLKLTLLSLERIHFRLHTRMKHAFRDRRDDVVDLLCYLRQRTLRLDPSG
ncbi:hypothetical protein [Rhodovulum sp. MB263]|uniref:hypothetical protein n=1 Tax=Rhodovulum sp. (strain MB263) TaxID=308754 RepID=UPI0009B7C27C|nr:hypothetical protein [Rhodovulum sp. MB263]ARC90787.1 hypothetical protein B5V46_19155 [Rhodovulum sp. MB263]